MLKHLPRNVSQGNITAKLCKLCAVFAYSAANVNNPAAGKNHFAALQKINKFSTVIINSQLIGALIIGSNIIPVLRVFWHGF